MRKWFLGILVALLLMLGIWQSGLPSEGTKVLKFSPEWTLVVPEMCPDFDKFAGNIVGAKNYENGNAMVVVETYNEDETVFALALLVKIFGKVNVIALQVSYLDKADPASSKTDYYEDLQFMKTGKISGKLDRVPALTDFKLFEPYVSAQEI